MKKTNPKIAFLLQNVDSGGVERIVVNLLKQLVKYPISIELVLFERKGNFLDEVPAEVKIVELSDSKTAGRLRRVFPLVRYLRQHKPDILVSQLVQFNVIAAIAKGLSGIPLRLILVEHLSFNALEDQLKADPIERIGSLNLLRYFFYRQADVIAAVSKGLAEELERHLKLRPNRVKVLYNPVVGEELTCKAQLSVDHPWFEANQPPIFVAVGRLAPQKGFSTLIQAFAMLRQKRSARLMILGEGIERLTLETQILALGLEADVSLPGFTHNPYPYMSKAKAFVLSSNFEALPTVLIEALACGCPVISTDCPYGPDEILVDGKYGKLVSVGDVNAMADAMEQVLDTPIPSNLLKRRAQDFTSHKVELEYLKAMGLDYFIEEESGTREFNSISLLQGSFD